STQFPRVAHVVVLDARTGAAPVTMDVALAGRNKASEMARIRSAIEGPPPALDDRDASATPGLARAEAGSAPEPDRAPEPSAPPVAAVTRDALGARDAVPPSPPPTEGSPAGTITRATVILEPKLGIANRRLDYQDAVTSGLLPYS